MQTGRYKHSLRVTFRGKQRKRRDSKGNPLADLLEERRSSQSYTASVEDTAEDPDDAPAYFHTSQDGDATENQTTEATVDAWPNTGENDVNITAEGEDAGEDATGDATEKPTTDAIEDQDKPAEVDGTAEDDAMDNPVEPADPMEFTYIAKPRFKTKSKFSSYSTSSSSSSNAASSSSSQGSTFKKKGKGFKGSDMPGMEGLGTDYTAAPACPASSWEGFSNTDLNELAQYGII